jgi:hypothetical protein
MKKLIMLMSFASLLLPTYAVETEYLTKTNFWHTIERKWKAKLPDYTAEYMESGYSYTANASFNAATPQKTSDSEYLLPIKMTTEVSYKHETNSSSIKKEYNETLHLRVFYNSVTDDYMVIDHEFAGEGMSNQV